MRLRERDKRLVYLRRRIPGERPDWEDAIALRAAQQPMVGSVAAMEYGDRVSNMRVLYYDGMELILPRDGICLYVGPEDRPDYQVVAPPDQWEGHTVIDIEYVPEGKR